MVQNMEINELVSNRHGNELTADLAKRNTEDLNLQWNLNPGHLSKFMSSISLMIHPGTKYGQPKNHQAW